MGLVASWWVTPRHGGAVGEDDRVLPAALADQTDRSPDCHPRRSSARLESNQSRPVGEAFALGRLRVSNPRAFPATGLPRI